MCAQPKKTILVVEDDADIVFTLTLFLEGEGYCVYAAANGQVALNILHERGIPNLILLDMKMPVMNGWQFAAEFMNRYGNKAPIVVMTAAADARQRAREISANDWVGKPFTLDDLLTKVRQNER